MAKAKPELEEGQEAVIDPLIDTAKAVADAKAVLAAAEAAHAEEVRKATPPDPQPEKGVHVLVDLGCTGTYALVPIPEDYNADAPERKILVQGQSCECVGVHASGVWMYRRM